MTHEEFLLHYGVKGMKWGVRKAGSSIAKARHNRIDKKFDKKYNKKLRKIEKAFAQNKEYQSKLTKEQRSYTKGMNKQIAQISKATARKYGEKAAFEKRYKKKKRYEMLQKLHQKNAAHNYAMARKYG